MADSLVAVDGGGRGGLAGFRNSLAYDALARLPLVMWFAICGWSMGRRLLADLAAAPPVDAAFVLDMLARAGATAFVLLIVLVLCVRRPAIARASGPFPRIAAFAGTFSITPLALFAPVPHSAAVSAASLLLILGGYAFACYALMHLGRSLSMMAEARKLVTTGPYGIVRHPLYVAKAVASIGLLLQYLSPGAIALWLAHIVLQFCRMQYEEGVLRANFPEYEEGSCRDPG